MTTHTREELQHHLDSVDEFIISRMARYGLPVLRIGLGIVYLWFGALKFFPGLSPAEDLVRATVFFMDGDLFLPLLATWEVLIGLGLLTKRFMRTTLLLLFLQMPGTVLPMFILPEVVWTVFPHGLTLEGQYIVKNLVLIGAALVIGSRVQSRRMLHQIGDYYKPS